MSHKNSRGFTLIAALLLTILLSGVAVGLLFMVTNEARMGGNDLEGNLAYYGAEAGMENLTSQLSQLYQQSQSPNAASLNALASPANYPTTVPGANLSNLSYTESIAWPTTKPDGTACPNAPDPCGAFDIVGSGPDQGMVATLIPFTLQVTATRQASAGQVSASSIAAASGASVNLTRTVEVALLPAFEFGIFCDGDCDYFAGPPFNFGGRVHTNGNLFLAANSGPLTFTDKIAAVGEVITDRLENNNVTAPGNYGGSVYIPTAASGCPAAPASGPGAGPCSDLVAKGGGSWTGGIPTVGGGASGSWWGTSVNTFNSFVINGRTGATRLQLPFVNSATNVGAIDIIRRPQAGDSAMLANSRLYTQAEIRILLADNINDLHPERNGGAQIDADDVQLGPAAENGAAVLNATAKMYYGEAAKATGNWTTAPVLCAAADAQWPLFTEVTQPALGGNPCVGTWLRVEYLDAGGVWHGVTREWLGFGFGRGYNYPPTAPAGAAAACPLAGDVPAGNIAGQCSNPISSAILILQQLQFGKTVANAIGAAALPNVWLPLNFYDAREGEPRDVRNGGTAASCSPNGVMNVVELDVGNLWLWLQGKAPYGGFSGLNVNSLKDNGYILYFSDRRGMVPDPTTTGNGLYSRITGMSGLEDVVNSASQWGVPDKALEAISYYNGTKGTGRYSPEDTNADGFLDVWGAKYLRAGFTLGAGNDPDMSQAYYLPGTTVGIASCATTGLWNVVTGPRHGLRLVDGGMDGAGNSYLPHPVPPATGFGFTVASEEPVYVYGNYNSGTSDPFFPSSGVNAATPHSAAAIIADAVTLLSNPPSASTVPANIGWTDVESLTFPGVVTGGNRPANTSYYRMAIAAGKSIPFPWPGWAQASGKADFGTDGGMHNFLRYLEDRSGTTVNYAGSMISMYYSQYATGNFKCCSAVYGAPTRYYFFDTQFLNPANLPPGTPMFQDVVSLSYHQNFNPQ